VDEIAGELLGAQEAAERGGGRNDVSMVRDWTASEMS
jgi:hypothetical protein